MTNLTESYTLKITVLSPVHIGTGERPTEKSRWESSGRLTVVDEDALFRAVAANPTRLSRFEQFCLNIGGLGEFLQKEGIAAESVASYSLPRWGGPARRDYYPFIKIPGRPPQPYLPGSSLKGAVRSAFLRAALLGDDKLRARANEWVANEVKKPYHNPKRADDALERAHFGRDQHHEWPRLYQFMDTHPLTPDALAVAETRVLSINNSSGARTLREKEVAPGKPMQLYPEIFRPGVVLEGKLNFLTYLLSSPADAELRFSTQRGSAAYLIRQCNRVAQEQITQELTFAQQTAWTEGEKFYTWLANQWAKAPANLLFLRLGWGAGYDDKTITDLLDDQVFVAALDGYRLTVGRPGRRIQSPPLDKPFAPKSRKVAQDSKGRWLPLGWLKIELSAEGM